jgi:serine/threonine-protein kinase
MQSRVEQIGRYQLLGEVGRGAMGVVYRAQDPAIGRLIAVKTINLADLTDSAERARLRDRLFREAQSAGILSHPNIVTIYDIAEENGTAYIFMEFVNGPPLEKLLADSRPLSRETILTIFRQTAAALDYAHRKGIVHRDIKPANILVHEDGRAKVTDFGVAKIVSQQMTQTGAMMGTPSYMSPEQVQGRDIDGRADQFALGVIAYEVLTGDKPFVADYMPTLLYRIVREEPASPHRLNPTLGPAIEAALRKALAKDPGDRFASCTDFANALEEACAATPGWMPLASGTSQSEETVAATALNAGYAVQEAADPHGNDATVLDAAPPPLLFAPPEPPAAPIVLPPPSRPVRLDESDSNPLFKNVAKVALIFLAVGALYGAYHFFVAPALPGSQPASEATVPDTSSPVTAAPPTPAPLPQTKPVKPKPAAMPRVDLPREDAPKRIARERVQETAPETPVRSALSKSVQFISNPSGASLSVDGQRCVAPCDLQLASGRHVLTAELAGYRTGRKIFQTPGESEIYVGLERAGGTLSVDSDPRGASITIDGRDSGRRTPSTIAVPVGHHRIGVNKDGARAESEVDLKDGDFHAVSVRLQ